LSDPDHLVLCTRPAPHVLQLTLNRPQKRNALSNALIAELAAALDGAAQDPDIRCAVLCGNHDIFSSGADIAEMRDRGFEAIDNAARRHAWDRIAQFPKPLIAAVDGKAFGGGHELALLADITIAGSGASFAQPEISIGILPGDGATQRLARTAGKSLTMLMVLTGEPIDAATAFQAGLVAEVVDDGAALSRALDVARRIAGKSPSAARLAKEAVLAAFETTLSAGLAAERRAIRHAFTTPDQREGMAAFFEKRAPRYEDS
jgi:enoyl-CoA hydratase